MHDPVGQAGASAAERREGGDQEKLRGLTKSPYEICKIANCGGRIAAAAMVTPIWRAGRATLSAAANAMRLGLAASAEVMRSGGSSVRESARQSPFALHTVV